MVASGGKHLLLSSRRPPKKFGDQSELSESEQRSVVVSLLVRFLYSRPAVRDETPFPPAQKPPHWAFSPGSSKLFLECRVGSEVRGAGGQEKEQHQANFIPALGRPECLVTRGRSKKRREETNTYGLISLGYKLTPKRRKEERRDGSPFCSSLNVCVSLSHTHCTTHHSQWQPYFFRINTKLLICTPSLFSPDKRPRHLH